MKKKKKPSAPGEVWEVYEGPKLEHAGFMVAERGNPHRRIADAPNSVANPSANLKKLYLRACRRIAADPSFASGSRHAVDMRGFGRLDSDDAMPVQAFHQIIVREGHGKPLDADRADTGHSFPFCRFRIAQMILSLPADVSAVDVLASIVGAMSEMQERATPSQATLIADFTSLLNLRLQLAR